MMSAYFVWNAQDWELCMVPVVENGSEDTGMSTRPFTLWNIGSRLRQLGDDSQ